MPADENIVLVAPRPVRLAAPTPFYPPSILHRPQAMNAFRFASTVSDALERFKLADDSVDDDPKSEPPAPSERDRPISPRASPRSTLPSEAMEEFLSILRPSSFLFPPTSPILRPSNGLAHGFVSYCRPGSCSLSPAMSNEGLGITLVDQSDEMKKDGDTVAYPFKIIGPGHLSSPVARAHTRNPFPRQANFENGPSASIRAQSASPSPSVNALSPTAVPLPLPTPDEIEHEPVS
ncbi:uncharacterized protein PHACADRAFT_256230 [Phanerochaete carnosa HHB-10118-sp]|uniref:Uncharacterized protein n=1 Tax=Phanerochaete carnosa (strain HHB-10118-sp) TaxID=650164 RepID=K5VVH1_PHACS|nr:uncharacterized protein PHACADRAFT_256230 [Phanerochaete carnosa HHB-10118-sp]EKM55533.1 hypothetical protein PHACADRAFT_256230 [Phanerochaete carnosa HHB-10118-sp]